MPRTGLTSDYKIELARKAAAPLMSAVFHFPAPTGDVFVSDRECTIGGQAHRGPVASFGNYKESLKARDGNFQIGHMPMEILNTPIFGAPAARFSDLWAGVALEGLEVDVYQNFRQAGGTILQAPFHSFVMRRGIYTPRTCAFDLISVSEKYLDKKEIGFLIDQTDFPRASLRAVGQRANILYGPAKRAKAHAIEANPASPLRAAMDSVQTVIPIAQQFYDIVNSAGRVQIGIEQIDYTGKSATGPSLTGCTRGVNETTADAHPAGAVVFSLLSEYAFLAAGHAVKAGSKVYIKKGDAEIPVDPSRYSFATADSSFVSGKTLSLIRFSQPPLKAERTYTQTRIFTGTSGTLTLAAGGSSFAKTLLLGPANFPKSSGHYEVTINWHLDTGGEHGLQFSISTAPSLTLYEADVNNQPIVNWAPYVFTTDSIISRTFQLAKLSGSGTATFTQTAIVDSLSIVYQVATSLLDLLPAGSQGSETTIKQEATGGQLRILAGGTTGSIVVNFDAQNQAKSSGRFRYNISSSGGGDTASIRIELIRAGESTIVLFDSDADGHRLIDHVGAGAYAFEGDIWHNSVTVTLRKKVGTLSVNSVLSVALMTVEYDVANPSAAAPGGELLDQSTADLIIGGEVLFDGEGFQDDGVGTYTGSAGALIENPADVLHHLARFVGGVPVGRIDVPAFAQARADLPAYYKLGGVVTERSSNLKELLLALGLQSRLRPDWPIDKLTVRALKTSYSFTLYDGAPKILTENQVAADGDGRKEPCVSTLKIDFSDPNDIINSFKILYGRDFSVARGAESFRKSTAVFEDVASINTNGLRQQAERFWCDFITEDNAAMANDMGAFWLVRLKNTARIVSLDCFLDQFPVINGDVIGLNFAAQKGGTGASFFPYTFPITFGAAGLPGEIFDGWNGTQMLLVEQFERRPGSARDKRGDRMALVLREVS